MAMTLAEALEDEAERLRRRIVHATRPKRPLTLVEAIELHKAMESKMFPQTNT